MQFVKRIIFIRNMRVFHALNIVYNLNPRAEAVRWRNNTKGEKSAQKGGFRKLHTYLRGDGERATVSIAGRGTEHSWRKKSGAVGSMEGGEPGESADLRRKKRWKQRCWGRKYVEKITGCGEGAVYRQG